jgi:hypothetical protein
MVKNRKHEADIVEAWNSNMSSMEDLAYAFGFTRQGICKLLKRNGCDTTKRRLAVVCATCGKEFPQTRKRVRSNKNNFCSQECYFVWLAARSDYGHNTYGSRMARNKVNELFPLEHGYIVHHIDGNGFNNTLPNLVVYKTQADHLHAHRGFPAEPIWVGKEHQMEFSAA